MASSVTVKPVRGVRGIGLFAIILGIIMMVAGAVTYGMVTSQLRDENITVSDDAQFFGGKRVQDPFTAYAQAEVINKHALKTTGGKTYAELSQDDPERAVVMNASFLRASLFTSVVAFGVAVFVVVCGLLFLLFGIAFRRLGRGDVTVLDVVPSGGAAAAVAPPVAPSAPVAPSVPTSAAPSVAAPAGPVAPAAPAGVAPVAPVAAAPVAPPVRESVQPAPGLQTPGAAARAAAPVSEQAVGDASPADGSGVPTEPASPPMQANPVHPSDDVSGEAGPGAPTSTPDERRPEL